MWKGPQEAHPEATPAGQSPLYVTRPSERLGPRRSLCSCVQQVSLQYRLEDLRHQLKEALTNMCPYGNMNFHNFASWNWHKDTTMSGLMGWASKKQQTSLVRELCNAVGNCETSGTCVPRNTLSGQTSQKNNILSVCCSACFMFQWRKSCDAARKIVTWTQGLMPCACFWDVSSSGTSSRQNTWTYYHEHKPTISCKLGWGPIHELLSPNFDGHTSKVPLDPLSARMGSLCNGDPGM